MSRLALAVALVVAAAGCGLHLTSSRRTVVVIGDSITVDSRPAIEAALHATELTIDATPGITLGEQVTNITDAIASKPDALVIELGTNNMTEPTDALNQQVTVILDAAAGLPCVRWVTVGLPGDATAAFNSHLHDEDAARDNFAVIDWAAISPAHPEWFQPDHVHPSEAGQTALAQAIAESLDTC